MNDYEYVAIGARKGLTTPVRKLNAKPIQSEDYLRMWLAIFIDDSNEIEKIIKDVNTNGFTYFESTNRLTVPTCFKLVTRTYFEQK